MRPRKGEPHAAFGGRKAISHVPDFGTNHATIVMHVQNCMASMDELTEGNKRGKAPRKALHTNTSFGEIHANAMGSQAQPNSDNTFEG